MQPLVDVERRPAVIDTKSNELAAVAGVQGFENLRVFSADADHLLGYRDSVAAHSQRRRPDLRYQVRQALIVARLADRPVEFECRFADDLEIQAVDRSAKADMQRLNAPHRRGIERQRNTAGRLSLEQGANLEEMLNLLFGRRVTRPNFSSSTNALRIW
jgi:hypothetical protein